MENQNSSNQAEGTLIGKAGEPIYALAFPGGLFDTTMQLGVAHAFIVSERRPPDIVLGVSTGALQAAAFAEVLQASPNLNHLAVSERKIAGQLIYNAQITRFRELLNAYRDAPRELYRAFFPDPLEISARSPLSTYDLPIHSRDDRSHRLDMVRSLAGLVGFLNDVLGLSVTAHHMVQAIHRLLRLAETGNFPSAIVRYIKTLWHFFLVLLFSPWNLWRLSRFAGQLLIRGQKGLEAKSMAQLISIPRAWTSRLHGLWVRFSGCFLLYFFYVIAWIAFGAYGIFTPFTIGLRKIRMFFSGEPYLPSLHSSRASRLGMKILKKLLTRYDLLDELTSQYPLRQFLIRILDPHYYGSLNMKRVVERAISQEDEPARRDTVAQKRFCDYSDPQRNHYPIKVVPVAANIKSGGIEILPEQAPVVDAILAAMAYPPWFKPVPLGTETYIDAALLTEVPIPLLIDFLKLNAHPDASAVNIYAVLALPDTNRIQADADSSFTSLGEITKRTLELQRHQHTKLVQRLTRLYNRLLPKGQAYFSLEESGAEDTKPSKISFIAAQIHLIAPQEPLRTNQHLLEVNTPREQEEVILHAVATGCRNTLELVLQADIALACEDRKCSVIKCQTILDTITPGRSIKMGSHRTNVGPGVPEVCECCTIVPFHLRKLAKSDLERQVLQKKSHTVKNHHWPHIDEQIRKNPQSSEIPITLSPREEAKNTKSVEAPGDPWITLLLSGGVFRGVFQIGVLNGLNEARVKPTVFAGSSVGSIVAAMAARVATLNENDSRVAMQEVAATFMSLDRLVVTDRFADFVRRFSVRANEVNISLKRFDEFFRRFDCQASLQFNKNARIILAGLERLLYVSPFEFFEFARALHDDELGTARTLLWRHIDVFFERYGIGIEMLGAEPLRLLIEKHVLPGIDNPSAIPFDYFKTYGKYLIATATNLTKGELHVFGMEPISGMEGNALLIEALLASSAFPSVFRPRRFSEIYPGRVDGQELGETKFVDGGITDNLPLDDVVTFMHNQSLSPRGLLPRRPTKGPHLLLTASLEPKPSRADNAKVKEINENWVLLVNRVRELQYNRKIQIFEQGQKNFRKIYNRRKGEIPLNESPLDIAVGTVIPNWMCDTFGFHAMLGFRHYKQAASIAHGCAMAFAQLAQLRKEYGDIWGFSLDCEDEIFIPETSQDLLEGASLRLIPNKSRLDQIRNKGRRSMGQCWFRKNAICPFSPQAIKKNRFGEKTSKILPMIYEYCGRPETHESLI